MHDCLGAIDSSYIPIEVPNSDKARYLNSEGYVSLNIMVACSFDWRFMYVNAACEGSRPDFAVLTSAVHEDLYVPEGRFIFSLYTVSCSRTLKLKKHFLWTGKYYLVDAGMERHISFLHPVMGSGTVLINLDKIMLLEIIDNCSTCDMQV